MNQTTTTRSPQANQHDEDSSLSPFKRFFQPPVVPVAADSTNEMQRKAKYHILQEKRTILR